MSGKLTTSRPAREGAAAEKPHVERARAVVQGDADEKKIPLQAPTRYHRGLQELKNMTSQSTPVKHLLLEAIDDLFEKYSRGEGRFEVEDTAELKRRLQALK
jgi:hypothetical protein